MIFLIIINIDITMAINMSISIIESRVRKRICFVIWPKYIEQGMTSVHKNSIL